MPTLSLFGDRSSPRPRESGFEPPARPRYREQPRKGSSHADSGERRSGLPMMKRIRRERRSVFRETGLLDEDHVSNSDGDGNGRGMKSRKEQEEQEEHFVRLTGVEPMRRRASRTSDQDGSEEGPDTEDSSVKGSSSQDDDDDEQRRPVPARSQTFMSKLVPSRRRPQVRTATAPPAGFSTMSRFAMAAVLIAVIIPALGFNTGRRESRELLSARADTQTNVCKRWSQQTALLNGTLYIYGGQAKTDADQENNTWTNDFLTLDLTDTWLTSSPKFTGLEVPDGPPAVANGYLWHDYDSLFLYGGEFADNPYVDPVDFATWKYSIKSKTWTSFDNPQTSEGNFSDSGAPKAVQRAAEGAGVSVPELGLSWYFGGHLDMATTPGWSEQTARVYLKSLLEFTHPGFVNSGVKSLSSGTGAGEGGVYRNITEGGLQTDKGFIERADGALVFVPGWGEAGILLGLGGGTNETFSDDLGILDVYDIKNSVWYHQQTKGDPPGVRVNPCAVIASAPDASSFQIYLYGGQNLLPFKEQTQYNDMYILTIPSFTWIKVPAQENAPPGRAGHTCNLRDGQMVVVGGFTNDPACEKPGVFVFNASSLEWSSQFRALSPSPDSNADNSVLAGSFGYTVPDPVVSVVGGDNRGGATATTPAVGPATSGPFATGKPPVFTVTAAGSAPTVTSGAGGDNDKDKNNNNRRSGLIAAGIIAGVAGLLAGYLGFCAWLYRRQVRAYRTHLAAANRYSGGVGGPAAAVASKTSFSGLAAAFFGGGRKGSNRGRGNMEKLPSSTAAGAGAGYYGHHRRDASSSTADSFGLMAEEPKPAWLSDAPTPLSGGTTGTSSSGLRQYAEDSSPSPYGYGSGGSGIYGSDIIPNDGSGSGGSGSGVLGAGARRPTLLRRRDSAHSQGSTEGLLEGQDLSFFSVVMGPRRALRVVNGLEEGHEQD